MIYIDATNEYLTGPVTQLADFVFSPALPVSQPISEQVIIQGDGNNQNAIIIGGSIDRPGS
jgi:hypothetical protein